MKKNVLLLTIAMAFGVFFTQCSEDSKVNTLLEVTAKAVNVQCPMKLAPELTMDKCDAMPNRTLRYSYTLTSDLSNVDTEAMKTQVKPAMIKTITAMPEAKDFKKYNVRFEFQYNDKDGKELYRVDIEPTEY